MSSPISSRSSLIPALALLPIFAFAPWSIAQPVVSPQPQIDCPSCDDNDLCTVDSCDMTTGTCRHTPLSCDDGNPCTMEFCVPTTPTQIGGCDYYENLPAGHLCDDGNPCTINTACDGAGTCIGQPLDPGSGCDDGNPCTVQDACTASGDCVGTVLAPGTPCDDGSLCTSDDICAETAAGMVICEGTLRNCDDGDACTVDLCLPATGECDGRPRDCDDRNSCTEDSCDPLSGCLRTFRTGSCDDRDVCTIGDACRDGNCIPGSDCRTVEQCYSVVCEPLGGIFCEIFYTSNDCSDRCYLAMCVRGSCEQQIFLCDDFNTCTDDACDPETGACSHTNNTGFCDDGNACTIGDSCLDGSCQSILKDCNDQNACTEDTCDPASGTCIHTIQGDLCDDANPCTDDFCNPETGACSHADRAGTCSDDDPCTEPDACIAGVCQGIPIDCDDQNACTEDACDPSSGACVYMNRAGSCEDGDACTVNDVCAEGLCRSGPPVDCQDQNVCTVDHCDSLTGVCVHTNNTSPCDDGDVCTRVDACSDGACRGGSPLDCDDGDVCTLDTCDPTSGCVHVIDPAQPDGDVDGVPDLCDNCPQVVNPDQNPCACVECGAFDIVITFSSPLGRGSGTVFWNTNIEFDVKGFNVVVISNRGIRIKQNDVLIPCVECVTGNGARYAFIIPKHRSGRNVFVEVVHLDGTVRTFGPAHRN